MAEFDIERAILIAIKQLGDDAYGVTIHDTIEDARGRMVTCQLTVA